MEINKTREQVEFTKKVGAAEWKVLKFNPSRYELNKILGKKEEELGEDIDYTGMSTAGNRTVRISVWLQDMRSGYSTPVTFFLEDADQVSSTGKTQFINAVGKTSYKDHEDNLDDWFKKAMTYRVAKKGEAELMDFVRNWLKDIELNLDKGGAKNNILLDMDRIFRGDLRELNNLVDSEFAGTVTAMATIRSKQTDEGMKQYQSIYNKRFLPGYCIRYFEPDVKTVPNWVSDYMSDLKGEYGPKDYFVLEPLRDYKDGENPVDSGSAVVDPSSPNYSK